MPKMTTDKTVIANLQTTCGLLAHLAGQYQVDVQELKGMDLDWLKARVKGWYAAAEDHLRVVLKRLVFYGQSPTYDAGPVEGSSTVKDLLTRAQGLTLAAFNQCCDFRKQAWESRADGVTDIYEHIVQELERQYFKITRELNLIDEMGEPDYIGARLEAGE